MLSNNLLTYSTLTLLVAIGGLQDFRKGEVSNWITVPLFVLGLAGLAARAFFSDDKAAAWLMIAIAVIHTLAVVKGWMGGADWKILIALFGLWPAAGIAAVLGAAVWGVIAMTLTGKRKVRFPGVTAFAVAVALTYIAQVSIITGS
ncbi:MAG: prepilin peptidase [Chloroflexota bacterium]